MAGNHFSGSPAGCDVAHRLSVTDMQCSLHDPPSPCPDQKNMSRVGFSNNPLLGQPKFDWDLNSSLEWLCKEGQVHLHNSEGS